MGAVTPARVDTLLAALTRVQDIAAALSEDLRAASAAAPSDGDLGTSLERVRDVSRHLGQAENAVLGVFLADPPAEGPEFPVYWDAQGNEHAEF